LGGFFPQRPKFKKKLERKKKKKKKKKVRGPDGKNKKQTGLNDKIYFWALLRG